MTAKELEEQIQKMIENRGGEKKEMNELMDMLKESKELFEPHRMGLVKGFSGED